MWSRVGGGLSILLARPPLEARSLCLLTHPNHPKYELLGFRVPFKVEPLMFPSGFTTLKTRTGVTHHARAHVGAHSLDGKMAKSTKHKKQNAQLLEAPIRFKLPNCLF